MDAAALTTLTILALLVRAGHAAHAIGSVRARSVADSAIRATLGSAAVILTMWLIGRALIAIGARGDTGRVEGVGVFFTSPTSLLGVFAVALVPAAIVESATAERMRVVGGAMLGAIVVIAWTIAVATGWSILRRLEPAHAAISAVWPLAASHVCGAFAAIVAARTLGPRGAKYNRDGSANFIPPHNLTWIVAGDAMLVVGMPVLAGVVAGEPSARVVNALLAASAATIAAAAVTGARERRVDVILLAASAVCGSVVGSLTTPEYQPLAVALGAFAGAALPVAAIKLDLKFRVDDPAGLALVHGIGGVLGALGACVAADRVGASETAVAMLASIGLLLMAGVLAAIVAFVVTKFAGRVSHDAEAEGVDLALHDVNAYPDFQQTMIKSYHLRQ